MLLEKKDILQMLSRCGIVPKGVLHVGAHECEELPFYTDFLNINKENCIWIDALERKVKEATEKGIPNVYHGVITDKDNDEIVFHVSNNDQSSSVLEFGTHAINHSWVKYVEDIKQKTITLDTFFKQNNLEPSLYDFWNFDIQGAELLALKGANEILKYAKAIYLEVNTEEVYKGCGLMSEIDLFLSKKGFLRVLTQITSANWGDALYVRIL